jgi:hypothetical protein
MVIPGKRFSFSIMIRREAMSVAPTRPLFGINALHFESFVVGDRRFNGPGMTEDWGHFPSFDRRIRHKRTRTPIFLGEREFLKRKGSLVP